MKPVLLFTLRLLGVFLASGSLVAQDEPSHDRKATMNGEYLLQKFDAILKDAKFIGENMGKIDDVVLGESLSDLKDRIKSYLDIREKFKGRPFWEGKEGRAFADADLSIEGYSERLWYLLEGVETDKMRDPKFFEEEVVAPLSVIHDRLLFLNGKPSIFMDGKPNQ